MFSCSLLALTAIVDVLYFVDVVNLVVVVILLLLWYMSIDTFEIMVVTLELKWKGIMIYIDIGVVLTNSGIGDRL